MPWQNVGPGQFTFEGDIAYWMKDFQRWFQQDTRQTPTADFGAWLLLMVSCYANAAKEKWDKQPLGLGKAKVAKVNSMIRYDGNKMIVIDLFDLLEYLADHLNVGERMRWEQEFRRKVQLDLKLR